MMGEQMEQLILGLTLEQIGALKAFYPCQQMVLI
jgi:hypothetical protein